MKIEGEITSDEDLFVEGNIEVKILAIKHEQLIGKSGQLKPKITAGLVRVEGTVIEDISGMEQVVMSKTGSVIGNIQSPSVTLEVGAKFKGSIEMDPGDQGSCLSPHYLI